MPDRMSECSPNEEEGADHLVLEEGDASQRKAPSSAACLWDRVRSRLLRPKVNNGPLRQLWPVVHVTSSECLRHRLSVLRFRFGPFNSLKTLHRTKDYLNGISLAQQHLPRGAGKGIEHNVTLLIPDHRLKPGVSRK